MKYVWRMAFFALVLIPVTQVHAEVTVVKKKSSDLRAFENLEARLKYLESYNVVYVAGDGKSQEVLKSGPARHSKKDGLVVGVHKRKS